MRVNILFLALRHFNCITSRGHLAENEYSLSLAELEVHQREMVPSWLLAWTVPITKSGVFHSWLNCNLIPNESLFRLLLSYYL